MTTKSPAVVAVTDESFPAEIEGSRGLAVLDAGAAWCAPCRMMGPVVDRLAEAYLGRVKVGALDVDQSPRTAARFGVRNLPTFLFFRDGALVDRVVGAVPRAVLERKIEEHL